MQGESLFFPLALRIPPLPIGDWTERLESSCSRGTSSSHVYFYYIFFNTPLFESILQNCHKRSPYNRIPCAFVCRISLTTARCTSPVAPLECDDQTVERMARKIAENVVLTSSEWIGHGANQNDRSSGRNVWLLRSMEALNGMKPHAPRPSVAPRFETHFVQLTIKECERKADEKV